MKFAIIESPFAPRDKTLKADSVDYKFEVQQNQDYARRASHILLTEFNTAPFASHLLYTQPFILDDTIEAERNLGISAGLELAKRADMSAVFYDLGISSGMVWGIKSAIENGRELQFMSFKDFNMEQKLPKDRKIYDLFDIKCTLQENGVDIRPFLNEKQLKELQTIEDEFDRTMVERFENDESNYVQDPTFSLTP